MKVRAKNLILDMLNAREGEPLPARLAVAACALFGISENNARVTLVRLTTEGLIESASRGHYQLTEQAHDLADEVATWRKAEERMRPWKGDWLVAHCALLGRSDRAVLRRRLRALQMLGFRELERELYARPDNIERDVDAVRDRLHHLGLESEAAIFVAADFDMPRSEKLAELWDGEALSARYCQQTERLRGWMARADDLDIETAAREAFLLGGRAIHDVLFDPLLPEPMVDAAARAEFFATVREIDRFGKAVWQRFFEEGA